jgi:hypothetical protein
MAPRFGDGKGHFPHQANPAAAENQIKPLLDHEGAESARRLRKNGIGAMGGTAKDANRWAGRGHFGRDSVHKRTFTALNGRNYG